MYASYLTKKEPSFLVGGAKMRNMNNYIPQYVYYGLPQGKVNKLYSYFHTPVMI